MKRILVFLVFSFSVALGQEGAISGDSPKIKLSIGHQAQFVSGSGKTIGGNSNKIKLTLRPTTTAANVPATPPVRTTTPETASKPSEQISGTPKYYSLIIGVDKYQFSSSNLPNLDKPVSDANALRNVLIEKYSFSPDNSILLANPTRADIIKALENMAKKITVKDNLLIFYAGHGIWDERIKVGYWLPSDSKTTDKSSWIANSTIRDYIAGIQSKHTLLISDACFSGSIFKTREVTTEINEWGIAKIYQLPSRKAMTSGTLTTVPDESKFMQYFVKRLNENSNKYLTAKQLFYSLEAAVLNNTSTVPQMGVIQDTGDEGGDFVFIKK
jgi:hypothetical protein